jgi:hypothetical protein
VTTAFVIMPFDRSFDAVYSELIKPACQAAGVLVHRADEMSRQRNVLRDLVTGLLQSDVIIADLTSNRANVFYELGIAHTLLRPVIVLTQDVSSVAFDLRLHRVIQYGAADPSSSCGLLEQALTALDGVELETNNPVGDFLPPAVLFKLVQANRRIRTAGELRLFRRGGDAFISVEGEIWKGLVVEPSYDVASVNWGASGSSWGFDGRDVASVPPDPAGVTLGPLPLTPRGDVRGTPYVRTMHGEVIYFDLYAWTIRPENALMQVERARPRESVHRSAMLDIPASELPEEP